MYRRARHGNVACQRDGVIVPQRQLLPSLVHQIKDELRVLAVLVRQHVLALKHGRVKAAPSVRREHIPDGPFDVFPAKHLDGSIIPRALET